MGSSPTPGAYARIYAVVRRIPAGRVATYGQVALRADVPGQARLVGYAMSALPTASAVPWHRVINAQGRISARREEPGGSLTQRMRLEAEGIRFDAAGRISLERFGWRPRARITTAKPAKRA
ncbi:MAG: MGMT family protein [Gemmatimonadota bacterium]|nr:MGMT family protein [Gemmatimonadota bacterium]